MDEQEEGRYVTASEAARELGVSRVKIAELISKGILPFEKDPLDRRAKLIPWSAIEQLRAKRAAGPKAMRRAS